MFHCALFFQLLVNELHNHSTQWKRTHILTKNKNKKKRSQEPKTYTAHIFFLFPPKNSRVYTLTHIVAQHKKVRQSVSQASQPASHWVGGFVSQQNHPQATSMSWQITYQKLEQNAQEVNELFHHQKMKKQKIQPK